ncbi:MAG: OB-fold domain-containing protein [Acidimicrobiales bacterium]
MSDVQFFRDGIDDERLLVRVCSSCARAAYPPMPGCPHCGHEHGAVVESCGRGTLYSWTVCHIAFDPAFADETPYVVGLVDVPEGARIVARVAVDPADLADGLPLQATYPRLADGGRRLEFVAETGRVAS